MDARPTDAELAAVQAVSALQDGRMELGAAYARIAAIAARQAASTGDVVQVPRLDVPMRDDQPRPDQLAPVTPLFDTTAEAAGPGLVDKIRQGSDATAVTAVTPAVSNVQQPSGRCHYRRAPGAQLCWAVITWNPATSMWLHAFADTHGRFPEHDAVCDPADPLLFS